MNHPRSLKVGNSAQKYWFCQLLSQCAVKALVLEASLTPKPGLVDQQNQGAHRDLTYALMLQSAWALQPYFLTVALAAYGQAVTKELWEQLYTIGLGGEKQMYQVTGDINTHKGAIWTLGLLVAGTAMGGYRALRAEQIMAQGAALANLSFAEEGLGLRNTHGQIVTQTYGVLGAKGQAQAGFPHLRQVARPFLQETKQAGWDKVKGYLFVLLGLMATLDDTCVLYRGGEAGLHYVQAGARELLALDWSTSVPQKSLYCFDQELISKNISSGGAADLLAAAIYFDLLEGIEKWNNYTTNTQEIGFYKNRAMWELWLQGI